MKIFLVLALAFIAVSQTDALKCYECGDSKGDTVCSSNKKDWNKKTCSKDEVCKKADGVIDGKTILARMCAPHKGKDDCIKSEGKEDKGETCFCSNEDYCNGSFNVQVSIVGTILLVAVSLFLSN